jgi:Protein of unknown function (DUF3551)
VFNVPELNFGRRGFGFYINRFAENVMRNAMWALMAVAGAYSFSSSPAEAARVYRYCLVEAFEPGPGTCYYDTYGQCMASASGRRAYCQLNPVIAFQEQGYGQNGYGYDDQPPLRKKKRRHHHHH